MGQPTIEDVKNSVIDNLDNRLIDKWQTYGKVYISIEEITFVRGFKLDTIKDKDIIHGVQKELNRIGIITI